MGKSKIITNVKNVGLRTRNSTEKLENRLKRERNKGRIWGCIH